MVSDILVNRIIADILPLAEGTMSEEELGRRFADSISSIFGVEKVLVSSISDRNTSERPIEGYLVNTKRPYVDNELSQYSAFPELIRYMNMGYKSYSAMPIVAGGEVIMYIEMLSKLDGRFTQEMLAGVGMSALIVGNTLAYKNERARSTRLARYFDAAFNSSIPQLLVSADGSIIKANKAALDGFKLDLQANPQKQKLKEVFGIAENTAKGLMEGKSAQIALSDGQGKMHSYVVKPGKISDSILHLEVTDETGILAISSFDRAISNSAEVCTILVNQTFNVMEASPNFERLFKCSKDSIINSSFFDFVGEVQKSSFLKFANGQEGKEALSEKFDLVLASREPTFVHCVATKSLNGYLLLLVKADAEKYANDIKRGVDYLISNTSDVVLIVDGSGYIKDCNLQAYTVLRYPKEEIIGKEISSLYATKDILERDIAYVRKGGFADNSHVYIIKKDGNGIPAQHSVRSLKSPDGYSDFMIIIKELETKQRMRDLEESMRQSENQVNSLKKESEQKANFVYNISHELKTPLTSVMGFAKLLKEGEVGALNEDQSSYIQTIIDESDRLMGIIQQVLDASKLDADKVKADIREMDFRDIVNNTSIKSLEERIRNKGLEFAWNVDFDVPNVYADTNRIVQVMVNLIGNALKFTEKGSIKVHVYRNGKSKRARTVRCDVTDTGIGISDDTRSKLFKKFYQAPKKELEKQDGTGTGLGLSISWYIIKKLHGGDIKCDSEPGKGSTFWFILPITPKGWRRIQKE